MCIFCTGCQTTSHATSTTWEGKHIETVSAAYGLPIDKYKDQDSNEVVTFLEIRSTELPGIIDNTDPLQASGAHIPQKQEFIYDCFHRFTTDKSGVIIKYEQIESGCNLHK
jgi:hypothetical protein